MLLGVVLYNRVYPRKFPLSQLWILDPDLIRFWKMKYRDSMLLKTDRTKTKTIYLGCMCLLKEKENLTHSHHLEFLHLYSALKT